MLRVAVGGVAPYRVNLSSGMALIPRSAAEGQDQLAADPAIGSDQGRTALLSSGFYGRQL